MKFLYILAMAAGAWALVLGGAFAIMALSRLAHGASIWPS